MRLAIRLLSALVGLAGLAGARGAAADPIPGFVEDFTTGTGGFIGRPGRSNPGTGGVDGAGDGFLRVLNDSLGNFGTRSGTPDYSGNYLAAGITRVKVWLNDVEGNQAFEIHFAIGNGAQNFWQYNPTFSPPENAWMEFEVDLLDSTQFTQTRGSGNFLGALQNVTNILLRHDRAPYIGNPDPIAGEMGFDKIQLVGLVPVEPKTWGSIKSLYR